MRKHASNSAPNAVKLGISDSVRDILSARFVFRATLFVSPQSSFGSDLWSWVDVKNERLKVYSPDRLTINWLDLQSQFGLTSEIVADLKRYAFLRRTHSVVAFTGNRRNNNAHPATVVNEIKTITPFLSHIRKHLSVNGHSFISKLSDIEAEDLSEGLLSYNRGQRAIIKKVLTYFTSPILHQLFEYGPVKWNIYDVENLPWGIKPCVPYERIPDDLFRFLSNCATADVKQFISALGIQAQDKTKIGEEANQFLLAFSNFKSFFEEYITELTLFRRANKKNKGESRYVMWLHSKGYDTKRFSNLVDRARIAAQLIITMYTGERLSELNSLKCGCLTQDDDGWLLRGTLVKEQDLNAPTSRDNWVAIPIIRDAVTLLEQTARVVESRDLFHGQKVSTIRMGSGSLSNKFNMYLALNDSQGKWKDISIHPHRFRHTLVFQMRRAGLNLPFITYQLKHRYDAINCRISNATIGYGNLDSQAARLAVEDANEERIKQIYHPDASIAGGGAVQHKARCKSFFEGMALSGVKVDVTLRQLAKQGAPLVDMGSGLCLGLKEVIVDGIKSDPPCIGQLRCNPVRCSNGIIPEYKKVVWNRIASDSRERVQHLDFAHAKSYYTEAAEEAEAVLDSLAKQ